MKILHSVLTNGFYGSERYCAELAAAQAQSGHDVRVLIQGAEGSSYVRYFHETLAFPSVPSASSVAGRVPVLRFIPPWAPAVLHRPMARWILGKERPDVVHTHLEPAARRVGRVAQQLGIPHVSTLHLGYSASAHAQCDAVLCLSDRQRAAALAEYDGEARVLRSWTPPQLVDGLSKADHDGIAQLREGYRAGPNTVVFGTIGRMVPQKGLDVLVQAFAKAFADSNADVRLIIVSSGERDPIVAAAAEADSRIILVGWQEKLAELYRSFDVYVNSSRFEPFALTVLEAMTAGCRIVLTRTDGPSEYLTDQSALWAETGDVDSLALALGSAATHGRQRIQYDLAPFAPSLAVTASVALYQDLIERRRR